MTADPKTILIVEDDPDAVMMFTEMLRVSGFRAISTSDSLSVMDLINKEQPAAIILDITMPDMSGFDLLRTLRKNPDSTTIPVILISTKSLPVDIKTGLDAGASVYLTKPVGYLDLTTAVHRVLTRL